MRNKLCAVLTGVVVTAFLILSVSSCKKKAAPWDSLQFAGTFSGTETCLLSGTPANTLNIAALSDSTIGITNLYGLMKTLTGNISHDTCIIQPQLCDTVLLQGMMIISADSLRLNIIATSFGRENKCNAVLIKQ
jgi:hypothetical protein